MKILILVLSYTEWPFNEFMKVQKETWGYSEKEFTVAYYHGGTKNWLGSTKNWLGGEYLDRGYCNIIEHNCSDAYNMMHWKFKLTLDAINYHQYDIIFRTNSCSYIVKEKLLEVAETLPKTGCYSGYQNGDYISGAGIFFSPDVLDILKAELTDEPHGAEDVLIGSILKGRVPMINDESRIDAEVSGFNKFGSYHYRAKTSNDNEQRQRDIDNLRKLHEHLCGQS